MAKILQGTPLENPWGNKSLGQNLFECAIKNADHISQVDVGVSKSETYLSLKQRASRLSVKMRNWGVTPQDVIVSCSGITLDSSVVITSTLFLGAKLTNLDITVPIDQIIYYLRLITPKIIFTELAHAQNLSQCVKTANCLSKIVVYENTTDFDSFATIMKLQPNEDKFKPMETDPDEIAIIILSRGLSNKPKAICHSHRSFSHIINNYCHSGLDIRQIMFLASFEWLSSLALFLAGFLLGGCRYFTRDLSPNHIFRVLENFNIRSIFLSPTILYQMADFPEKGKASALHFIAVTGGGITALMCEKIEHIFGRVSIMKIYGLSKIGPACYFNPHKQKREARKKSTSLGQVSFGNVAKVVDLNDHNSILQPHDIGEICLKGPSLLIGYYGGGGSLEPPNTDPHGFLKTGDIGYYDDDDCLYVLGRNIDTFKCMAKYVVPAIIEAVLYAHPSVQETVVFGTTIAKKDIGEGATACVVLRPNYNTSLKELEDFVEQRVNDHEKLYGGLKLYKSFPKTDIGEIDRAAVRIEYNKSKH